MSDAASSCLPHHAVPCPAITSPFLIYVIFFLPKSFDPLLTGTGGAIGTSAAGGGAPDL